MTDNNRTNLFFNMLQFHSKEKHSPTSTAVDEVDVEMKIEPEDEPEGTWVHQNVDGKELLENENRNLECSAEQLLNRNPVSQSCKTECRDYCVKGGHLIHILNNEVEVGVYGRAADSIPKSILEIKGTLSDDYNMCERIHNLRTPKMDDNNGTDLDLLKFHIKEECSLANVKVEEVDEGIIKIETEVLGGSWVHQNVEINELLQTKNEDRNLENSAEQLNENDDNDCLSTGILKKKCEKNVALNHAAGKNQKPECNDYTTTEFSYAAAFHLKSSHMKSMEKPFKCSECSYSAVKRRYLVSHIKCRHTTMEKAYKCNVCSFEAVQKYRLLRHIKFRHTMEKPYKCEECSYAAVQNSDLRRHINSCHTLEKIYKFNECSYAAVQNCDLRRHINSCHTLEKIYKCNECSYAAVQKRDLLSHIKCHHTMEEPMVTFIL